MSPAAISPVIVKTMFFPLMFSTKNEWCTCKFFSLQTKSSVGMKGVTLYLMPHTYTGPRIYTFKVLPGSRKFHWGGGEFGEQIEFRLFGNRIVDILVKILDRLSLSFGACLQGCTSHLWVLTSWQQGKKLDIHFMNQWLSSTHWWWLSFHQKHCGLNNSPYTHTHTRHSYKLKSWNLLLCCNLHTQDIHTN